MHLFIRCVDGEVRLGPGKIKLLEMISAHGSISEAARSMDMSYRRAWLLVAELNHCFREPVTTAQTGGKGGGRAELTEFGQSLIARYRKIERDATAAVAGELERLKDDILKT
ncbi:MAG TPA: winged helix-turn-helix domain-containing protein [Alphaproteobacteria bacterium]|jgi:molybdate transport system regulatory protein|nr:winged helix-turn-helix domain-containing protein [Alphaproteobacteria bacterium]